IAAEEGRKNEIRAVGGIGHHESVRGATLVGFLIGVNRRKVGRTRGSHNEGVSSRIYRDPVAEIVAAATGVSRPDEVRGVERKLGNERVLSATVSLLKSIIHLRKIIGIGLARNVGVALGVDRDGVGDIVGSASHHRRENSVSLRVEFNDESIHAASIDHLVGAGAGGEVGRGLTACQEYIALAVE